MGVAPQALKERAAWPSVTHIQDAVHLTEGSAAPVLPVKHCMVPPLENWFVTTGRLVLRVCTKIGVLCANLSGNML